MPGEPFDPAVQETLLQRHPHKMGAIYQNLVIGHAVTAHLLFGLCIIYLWASMKAKPLHTYRKLFVLLWVLHIANGGIPAMHRLVTHGLVDANYLVGFSLGQHLLFFIVVCMMCVYRA